MMSTWILRAILDPFPLKILRVAQDEVRASGRTDP